MIPALSTQPDGVEALELSRVRRNFGAAADRYDRHAALQREARETLLARLDTLLLNPKAVLDLGCGPGEGAHQLQARFPAARVAALDFALPMLEQTRRHQTLLPVAADAHALPFADAAFDLVFSSLMLQWCDAAAVLRECRRVLRPGGWLLFSTFGPGSLHELRAAWQDVDGHSHVNAFAPPLALAAGLYAAGFREQRVQAQAQRWRYADVFALMQSLRGIGAVNAMADRRRALTGKGRLAALQRAYPRAEDGGVYATYELLYGQARA